MGDLGKLIAAKGFKKLPKVQKIAKSGHTVSNRQRICHFSGQDGGARPYSQHKNQQLRQQAILAQNGLLPESLLWDYIIQLTSGLRQIHSASLACRTLVSYNPR